MKEFDDYPAKVHDRWTVAGFLKYNFKTLVKRYGWKKSTETNYKGMLLNHILNYLSDCPMEAYRPDCCYDIERAYVEKATETNQESLVNKRNTIRRLIRRTFLLATEKGVVPRGVWTSNALPPLSVDRLCQIELKREVPRFLDPVTLCRLFETVDISASDRNNKDLGVEIEIETGARPSEVCGVSYADCECNCDGQYYLLFHNTKDIKKATRKGYGKTGNAPRKAPISQELYQAIMEDFNQLQHLADEGMLSKSDMKRKEKLSSFPILYKNEKNRFIPVSTSEFSNYCTDLIRNSIYGETLLDTATELINESPELLEDLSPEERTPTTYVLRHVYYTFLTLHQCKMQIRQALMGHQITEGYQDANYYFESKLFAFEVEKIQHSPLLNRIFSVRREETLSCKRYARKNAEELVLHLPAMVGEYCIDIEANEPTDPAIIEFINVAGLEGSVIIDRFDTDNPPPKIPNINTDIARQFRAAMEYVRKERAKKNADIEKASESLHTVDQKEG